MASVCEALCKILQTESSVTYLIPVKVVIITAIFADEFAEIQLFINGRAEKC